MIGFFLTGDPKKKHGPQPYIGYLSDMCKAFDCLPRAGGLEDQDLVEMRAMLEYRNAAEVCRIEESGSQDERAYLAQNPGMAASVLALHEAQDMVYTNPAMARAVEAVRRAEKEYMLQMSEDD